MSSKFKTLLDAQADNFDELKFYFHHLLSGDCREDEIIESSIDQGAEDCDISDDCYEIYCQPSDLHSLGEKLEKKFGDANLMKIIWKPENNIVIDQDAFTKIDRLIELLDDNDDVQDIYFNFDIPDDFIS